MDNLSAQWISQEKKGIGILFVAWLTLRESEPSPKPPKKKQSRHHRAGIWLQPPRNDRPAARPAGLGPLTSALAARQRQGQQGQDPRQSHGFGRGEFARRAEKNGVFLRCWAFQKLVFLQSMRGGFGTWCPFWLVPFGLPKSRRWQIFGFGIRPKHRTRLV